jgi:hypothetical protein
MEERPSVSAGAAGRTACSRSGQDVLRHRATGGAAGGSGIASGPPRRGISGPRQEDVPGLSGRPAVPGPAPRAAGRSWPGKGPGSVWHGGLLCRIRLSGTMPLPVPPPRRPVSLPIGFPAFPSGVFPSPQTEAPPAARPPCAVPAPPS